MEGKEDSRITGFYRKEQFPYFYSCCYREEVPLKIFYRNHLYPLQMRVPSSQACPHYQESLVIFGFSRISALLQSFPKNFLQIYAECITNSLSFDQSPSQWVKPAFFCCFRSSLRFCFSSSFEKALTSPLR